MLRDARDVAGDPLDVRDVSFGQRDTRMSLRIRTEGAWNAGQLDGDALCLVLLRDKVVGRVCVGADGGAAVLRYSRVAPNGIVGRPRKVPAALSREDERSLSATFHPRAVGLRRGRIRWSVESHWHDADACAGGCDDRVPSRGHASATISALAQRRCFGAAARTLRRPCQSPSLRTAVIPSPGRAALMPDSPCRLYDDPLQSEVLRPCEFGDLDIDRAADIALIGDSHTAHWRAAVDVAAQARGWRAVSMTRPGCALSTEAYPAPAPVPANCHRHSDEAIGWLRAHPSVHVVITSSSAGRGLGVAGFLAMWRRVPATVRRIYVIRDVPRANPSTRTCVLAVMRRHERSAGACAIPRGAAIIADPAAEAAAQAGSRVRLVDLTHYFCGVARCLPIVGGAYVYKDDNHMNAVFSRSLGPFLLRRLT